MRVLEQALSQVNAKPAARDTTIGGIRATPRHLREALEESYRRLADLIEPEPELPLNVCPFCGTGVMGEGRDAVHG